MSITDDKILPTVEELTVEEIPLSTAPLKAAAFHLGKACEYENNEFLLCRHELKDPAKCLNEGKAVTACALKFFRAMKKNCFGEFNQYAYCLEKSSGDFAYKYCRQTQGVLDKCVLEKMNIERPYYGYYTKVRIHDSPRPAPPPRKKAVYEDATPGLPEDYPRTPAKYGSREEFMTE